MYMLTFLKTTASRRPVFMLFFSFAFMTGKKTNSYLEVFEVLLWSRFSKITAHKGWNYSLQGAKFPPTLLLRLCGGQRVDAGCKAAGCFLLTSHGCRMTSHVLICEARLPKQRARSDLCGFTDGRKASVFCATRFLQGRNFSFLPALSGSRNKVTRFTEKSFKVWNELKESASFACGTATSQLMNFQEDECHIYHHATDGLMIGCICSLQNVTNACFNILQTQAACFNILTYKKTVSLWFFYCGCSFWIFNSSKTTSILNQTLWKCSVSREVWVKGPESLEKEGSHSLESITPSCVLYGWVLS